MQKDVAQAHATTMRDLAGIWERDGVDGGTEVAFLLRRAAAKADKTAGIHCDDPVDSGLKAPESVDEVRD